MEIFAERKHENEIKVCNFKYDEFVEEIKRGYLYWEIEKKRQLLMEYLNAYQEIEDKNTFNAQYLETLIDVLKAEISK
ncbi:MAG: hypothetical protein ACFE9T_07650 [Promethearchaeota archaeon]